MNFSHLSVRKWSSRFTPSVMLDSGTASPVGNLTWIPVSRTGSRTQVVLHPKALAPLTRTGLLNSVRFIGFSACLVSASYRERGLGSQRGAPEFSHCEFWDKRRSALR